MKEKLLTEARGKHAGARAVVVACGPSLQRFDAFRFADLSSGQYRFITKTPSGQRLLLITMNDALLWAPLHRIDYHVVINPHWFEVFPSALQVLCDRGALVGLNHMPFQNYTLPPKREGDEFRVDLSGGVFPGNATAVTMQWAAHLGCAEVFVLGLDLKVENGVGHGSDPTRPTNERNLRKQKMQFRGQNRRLLAQGVRVYNCNPDTACAEFPYRPYEEAFL